MNTTVKATCSVIDSLVGKASISSKSMSDSIIVTNITGSRGSSPIIIGLCEYFQVGSKGSDDAAIDIENLHVFSDVSSLILVVEECSHGGLFRSHIS